jgi:hypothetical protein
VLLQVHVCCRLHHLLTRAQDQLQACKWLEHSLVCLTRAERSENQREKKVFKKSVQAQMGFTGLTTTTPFWVRHFLPKAVKTLIYTYIIDM